MSNRVISRNQWIALQSGSLPVIGHFLLVANLISIAGRDAWISALISIPIGFLFAAIFLTLKRRWEDMPLIDGIYRVLGPIGGTLISAILVLYFLSISVITLRGLEQFIISVFMPETPYVIIGMSFILLVIWAMYRNIESIARSAVVIVLFIILTGMTVGFLLEKDYVRIFPLLEDGWVPVLSGTVLFTSIWSELIAVLMFRSRPYSLKNESVGWIALILFNGILFILSQLSVLAAFNLPLAAHLSWPVQEEVRLIRFGVVSRVDIYGLFTMTAGCFIRITLFLFAASETIAHMIPVSSYKSVIWPTAAAVLITSLLPFWNEVVLNSILHVFYSYTFLIILIPLGLLFFRVKTSH